MAKRCKIAEVTDKLGAVKIGKDSGKDAVSRIAQRHILRLHITGIGPMTGAGEKASSAKTKAK